MEKLYYRLCLGLDDIGNFYPIDQSPYEVISNLDQEIYRSVYYYTESQVKDAETLVEILKKDGTKTKRKRGVGKCVLSNGTHLDTLPATTNRLIFDFDSDENPDNAKSDVLKLLQKLEHHKITSEDVEIYYSGNKGYHVIIETDQFFNSGELKSVCMSLAQGLVTIDTRVYNDARILRLPHSKHQKSGRYCTPVFVEDLVGDSEEIYKIATQKFDPSFDKIIVNLDKDIIEMKKATVKSERKVISAIGNSFDEMKEAIHNIDFSKKWNNMPPAKWVLHEGFIPRGFGQEARMILAATYKSMMMCEEDAYRLLKSVSERRVKITGDQNSKFDTEEIWNNVISTVYSPLWQGGNYSVNNELLKAIDSLLPAYLRYDRLSASAVTDKDEAFARFINYAQNVEKNTIKFGITSLDKNIRIMSKNVYSILGPPGVGKCHSKGTKILMFDGSIKNVEDIKIGEQLMGDDSTPRNVLSLARGEEELYDIVPKSGADIYGVNESHILSLQCTIDGEYKGCNKGSIVNISVKDYLQKSKEFKKRHKGYKVAVEFDKKDLPFDPYLIGLWLGGGTHSKPSITVCDKEISDYIENFCEMNGYTLTKHNLHRAPAYNIVTNRGQKNPFGTFIKGLSESKVKFIPNDYLTSSIEDRKRLLAGLLDTDGYKCHEGCYEFTNKSIKLAEQTKFIADSLGFMTTMKDKTIMYKGEKRTYKRLYISGDFRDIPLLVERKRSTKVFNKKTNLGTYSFEVVSKGIGEYYGFELDGNHLYCLADCTVTHNTSIILQIMENTSNDKNKTTYFSFDMSLDDTLAKIFVRHTGKDEELILKELKEGNPEVVAEYKKILETHYKNVDFVFRPSMKIEDMEREIVQQEQNTGIATKLVIVDYLTLIKSDAKDANSKTEEAIQGLRYLAHSLNCAVVVLVQPNKEYTHPDKPIKSYNGIKGSSAVSEACTAIITAYREGFDPTSFDDDKYFTFICVKNRKGRLFSQDYHWDGKRGLIRELKNTEREELKELREKKKEKENSEKKSWGF